LINFYNIQATMEKTNDPALGLHYSSFVYDYYPLALPLSVDEEMLSYMDDALQKQVNGNAVIYEFFRFYLRRLEEGGESGQAMKDKLESLVREAGVNCIALTLGDASKPLDEYESIIDSLDWWERFRRSFEHLKLARSSREIEKLYQSDKLSLIFSLQDLGCIAQEISRIKTLYERGVRIAQLTYNGPNSIGFGCAVPSDEGLTDFGREAIEEMNRLGMVVDLSHCGPKTTAEGIAASKSPPVVTHSSSSVVFPHARAKSDEVIRDLAEKDGFFGVYTVPFFLTDQVNPGFDIFLRHLEHVIGLMGIERVGIGSDWGLWSPDVPKELLDAAMEAARKMGFSKGMNLTLGTSVGGMQDYTGWYRITEALIGAGYSEDQVRGLIGGNFFNYLKRAGV